MAQFTSSEAASFRTLGWEVGGTSAYVHLDALGMGVSIDADGDLSIQRRGDDGKWRWTHREHCETATLAACRAADAFFALTGWELLSRRGV